MFPVLHIFSERLTDFSFCKNFVSGLIFAKYSVGCLLKLQFSFSPLFGCLFLSKENKIITSWRTQSKIKCQGQMRNFWKKQCFCLNRWLDHPHLLFEDWRASYKCKLKSSNFGLNELLSIKTFSLLCATMGKNYLKISMGFKRVIKSDAEF